MYSYLIGKKLLVLGGTQISCEIIRAAKQMGIYTIVTDYNTPENSPAKRISDASFMVSTTDVDAVVDLIKREGIDGVLVGFNDLLLPYYADICKKAGLPSYGTKEQFEIFINKDKYKALMRQYGVPTVEEYQVDIELIEECEHNIDFPVLVKPADSSGARGISVCYTNKELKEAFAKAKAFSKTEQVLVEKYLTGKEVTVFWIFQDGNYYLAGIGNRHVKNNQEGVIPLPAGYTYPAKITDAYIENIMPKAKRMFQEIGIKDGMMFMQCKVDDDNCIVYDIGYRLTGSLEYKNFQATCGYNPMEMLIHFALTGKMAIESIADRVNPYLGKYNYNVSFLVKPGKIAYYEGLDDLQNIPGVIDAVIAHYPGKIITDEMKGLLAQISLRVLGVAESKEDLWTKINLVQNTVKIISDEGENLVLPGVEKKDVLDVFDIID